MRRKRIAITLSIIKPIIKILIVIAFLIVFFATRGKVEHDREEIAYAVFSFLYIPIYSGICIIILKMTICDLYAGNRVRLGILHIIFLSIIAGVLIINMEFDAPQVEKPKANATEFEKMIYEKYQDEYEKKKELDRERAKDIKDPNIPRAVITCSICNREIKNENKYIVNINNKNQTICEDCLIKERKEHEVELVSSSYVK
jgi:hypothetical protein